MTAALKSLTFTTLPKPGANPALDRRLKVIARLEEQKALLHDPNYTRTVRTSAKKDGERTVTEKQQRVLPWLRLLANGSYAFFVHQASSQSSWRRGKLQ
jgi:hypothetical protein